MYKLNKIPREWLLLIIIAIIAIAVGVFEWNKTSIQDRAPAETILDRRSSSDGGGISKEEAAVTVIVEYLPEKSTNNMVFQIVLDTHSVNLDAFDFQKEIALEKNGKSFSPNVISKEGSVHHRKAVISFGQTSVPFTIVVMNLSGVPRREFKFNNFN